MPDPYTGVVAWNNAEGGTVGVAPTTGNSGGTSGTAWSGVQITGASTITYESSGALQDTKSYLVVGSGGFGILRWDTAVVGTQTTPCGAIYLDYSTFPSAYTNIVEAFSDDASTVRSFAIRVSSAGNVRLVDSTTATVASGSVAISTNKGGNGWRIEWQINHTTGAYVVEWFDGDSTTRVGFISGTHASGGAGFGATGNTKQYKFGRTITPDFTAKIDTIAIDTAKLGPRAVANTPPVGSAGADKTNGAVGTPIALTGTDSDADGTITAREWTCVGRPTGTSAPTLTGATTATVSFTPAAQGVYTMSYRVQDNLGTWSTPDTALVYVLGTSVFPIAETSGSGGAWTNVGGAADQVAAMVDASDTTYSQSNVAGGTPSVKRYRLAPMFTPTSTGFSLDLRIKQSVAGSMTTTAKLIEGGTTRKTWTLSPSTTAATPNFTLTGPEIATVTSWLALDLEFSAA